MRQVGLPAIFKAHAGASWSSRVFAVMPDRKWQVLEIIFPANRLSGPRW